MNQPQPNQQSAQPAPASGGSLKWLLVVLIIVILGGGGYYYYASYIVKPATTSSSPSPTLTAKKSSATSPATSPTGSSSVPADWKTYQSADYGYSFKYPSNFYLVDGLYGVDKKQVSQGKWVFIDKNPINADQYKDGADWPTPYFEVIRFDRTIDPDQKASQTTEKHTTSQISVAGEQAVKIVLNDPSGFGGEYATLIYFNHDQNGFEITWKNSDSQGTHDSEIDQILSTFQFTQ